VAFFWPGGAVQTLAHRGTIRERSFAPAIGFAGNWLMTSARWFFPVIAGVLALLLVGFLGFGAKPWQWLVANRGIVVTVAEVKQAWRPVVLHLSGELQPAVAIDVFSRVAGRLTVVKFKTGDTVAAGEVIASVYSNELTERLRSADVELVAVRKQLPEKEAQAAEADRQLARNRDLFRRDLIPRRDVAQAESQVATARAQLDLVLNRIAQQEAMRSQARKLEQLALIVAPISGEVIGALSAGAPVSVARAILTIAQVETLKLVGAAPAGFTGQVCDGMSARVSLRGAPATARAGKVVCLNTAAKATGAGTAIEIYIDNRDHGLPVGAEVEATLNLHSQEKVLTMPRAALQSVSGRPFVFQIVNDRAVRRAVKLDDLSGDPVVIHEGLNIGDSVVVEGAAVVEDGTRVHPAGQARIP